MYTNSFFFFFTSVHGTEHSQAKETEIKAIIIISQGFPGGSVVKNLPANAGGTGDAGSIPRSGRSLRGGNGNPL